MSRTPRYSGDDLEDDDNEDYEEDYEEEDFDAYVSSPKAASGVNTKDGTEKDEVVMDLAAYMKEMEKKEEQDDCQEDDAVNPAKQQSLEGFSPNPNNLNQKLFQKKFIGSDTKSQERKEGEVSFLEMIKSSTKDDAQSSPYNPSSSSDNVLENNFTLSPRNKVKINNDLVERAKARLSKQELDQPIQQLIEIRKSGSSVHSVHGEHGDGPSSDVQALLNSVNKENKEKKERTKEENEANAFRVDALLMELFPEKADLFADLNGGKGKGKKAQQKKSYGMGAKNTQELRYSQSTGDTTQEDEPESAPDALQQANTEIKRLKKEMKTKEEKLTRVTEHSMMLGAHMDRVKGESAVLSNKLKDMTLELQAKEARLQSVLKGNKKKKIAKEKIQRTHQVQEQVDHYQTQDYEFDALPIEVTSTLQALSTENVALQEREHALLSAVEELSLQNEDLIQKLQESMQRELTLSSQRAASISAAAFSLPNIHCASHPTLQAHQVHNQNGRAQSEPVGEGNHSKRHNR